MLDLPPTDLTRGSLETDDPMSSGWIMLNEGALRLGFDQFVRSPAFALADENWVRAANLNDQEGCFDWQTTLSLGPL